MEKVENQRKKKEREFLFLTNLSAHGYTPAMNNYFGVGVDAQVAHDFHTAREANPEKFSNRTLNKLKYVTLGVTTSLKGLSKAVSLFCDDVQVAVPENSQAVE